jgi:hypothetical protein
MSDLPFISTPLQSRLALSLTPSTATLKLGDHSASRRAIYRVNMKPEPGSWRQDESRRTYTLCLVGEMKVQKLFVG